MATAPSVSFIHGHQEAVGAQDSLSQAEHFLHCFAELREPGKFGAGLVEHHHRVTSGLQDFLERIEWARVPGGLLRLARKKTAGFLRSLASTSPSGNCIF